MDSTNFKTEIAKTQLCEIRQRVLCIMLRSKCAIQFRNGRITVESILSFDGMAIKQYEVNEYHYDKTYLETF